MKTIKLSHVLHISALSLSLGLFSSIVSADDTSKYKTEDGSTMHEQGSHQKAQPKSTDRDDIDSTTRSGANDIGDTDPAGTDATRSVPGEPDAGTNPATEPGTSNN